MKDYCKGDMQKWAKKLTKKQAQEVLRKVLGEWRTEDLPNDQMLVIWQKLKTRKPYYSTGSFHVSEDRYRLDGKTYHVFWAIGDHSKLPMSIGVRVPYNWDEPKKKQPTK